MQLKAAATTEAAKIIHADAQRLYAGARPA
jgi:hypothetical protein